MKKLLCICVIVALLTSCSNRSYGGMPIPRTMASTPFSMEEALEILEVIEKPILIISKADSFEEIEDEYHMLLEIYGADADVILGSFFDMANYKKVYSILRPLIFNEGVTLSAAQIERYTFASHPELDYEWLRITETYVIEEFNRDIILELNEKGNWKFVRFEGSGSINIGTERMTLKVKNEYSNLIENEPISTSAPTAEAPIQTAPGTDESLAIKTVIHEYFSLRHELRSIITDAPFDPQSETLLHLLSLCHGEEFRNKTRITSQMQYEQMQ